MWRLAFFSRLEERKGIKLFVDAVSSLNVTNDKFEVRISNVASGCTLQVHNVPTWNWNTSALSHCLKTITRVVP